MLAEKEKEACKKKKEVPVSQKYISLYLYIMSLLQRFTTATLSKAPLRSFTTSASVFAETTTSTKPKGLYQFFENSQALPEQIWTGNI